MTKLLQFAQDESGATAIEYGLVAGGIAVAIIGIIGTLGDQLAAIFTELSDGLESGTS